MAIPAIRPAQCSGFALAEAPAALGVTDLVGMFELEGCDGEGEVREEVDETPEDEELVDWLPFRTASFNGLESILSGTMVPNQGNDT
jgi:hypothetical protein